MKENYADPVDRAVVEQEAALAEGLRLARQVVPSPLPYTGHCYNCQEPLAEPMRYCDKDCQDDYKKISRSRSVQFRRLE